MPVISGPVPSRRGDYLRRRQKTHFVAEDYLAGKSKRVIKTRPPDDFPESGDADLDELRRWHSRLIAEQKTRAGWLDDMDRFDAASKTYGRKNQMDSAALNFVISLPWLRKTGNGVERLKELIVRLKQADLDITTDTGATRFVIKK